MRQSFLWCLCALSASLLSCKNLNVTGVMLALDSNVPVLRSMTSPPRLTQVSVTTYWEGEDPLLADPRPYTIGTMMLGSDAGTYSLPATILLAVAEGNVENYLQRDLTRRVSVKASYFDGDTMRTITQDASFRFERDRVLRLEMFLASECADGAVRCSATQTCGEGGRCVDIARTMLPVEPGSNVH